MSEYEATLRVTTRSGATYEFADGMSKVRRLGPMGHPMRCDGDWKSCYGVKVEIGHHMEMWLTEIADEGPTRRITTPVVDIEGVQ